MLYGILTEWNEATFNGSAIEYASVAELVLKVWKHYARDEYTGVLSFPDGPEIDVAVGGEFVCFILEQHTLGYQLIAGRATRLTS